MHNFSVVIPVFKDIRIIDTISSIRDQNYPKDKIRVIIIDGLSGEDFINKVKDSLSINDLLISSKDDGIFDAINKGINQIQDPNEIVFVLGSDDRIRNQDTFKKVDRVLDKFDFVSTTIAYTDESWLPVRLWTATNPSFINFIFGRQVAHFGFFARKKVYEVIGLFDKNLTVSADFEFFLRLMKEKALFGTTISDHCIDMKLGGNSNKSLSNIIDGQKNILTAGRRHSKLLIYAHLLFKPIWKLKEYAIAKILNIKSKS